eukprot:8484923-Pyramimonas_sp.AAC.1
MQQYMAIGAPAREYVDEDDIRARADRLLDDLGAGARFTNTSLERHLLCHQHSQGIQLRN